MTRVGTSERPSGLLMTTLYQQQYELNTCLYPETHYTCALYTLIPPSSPHTLIPHSSPLTRSFPLPHTPHTHSPHTLIPPSSPSTHSFPLPHPLHTHSPFLTPHTLIPPSSPPTHSFPLPHPPHTHSPFLTPHTLIPPPHPPHTHSPFLTPHTQILRGFSVGDTPKLHPLTLVVPNISQESCKNQVTGDTPTGHQEMLEFFIIQTLIGEMVRDLEF